MKVITAKTAGFCFGVRRAVDTVYEEISHGGRIYTYGPIIHNDNVVNDLAEKGVTVINSREELAGLHEGTMIIRSHGVEKDIYELIKKSGLKLIDATCPYVLKIHRIVAEAAADGEAVVIIGDAEHPEVQGIVSFAGENVTVLETADQAEKYEPQGSVTVCIVSQTTFNLNKFKELVEIFAKKGYSIHIVNTICNATAMRQEEAMDIAGKADSMIVIGGAHSSNTRKLYDICKTECDDTFFVQTLDDLVSGKIKLPETTACVGITAGASTPNNIIEEVQSYVRGTDF